MADDLIVNDTLVIPGELLTVNAVRSSGPGGQNVNKVASKIELRFDLAHADFFGASVRARLVRSCRGRLDAEGRIVVTCEANRTQSRNLAEARDKLAQLIREALVPPKPRHATKPTRASQVRRVEDKRRRSTVKQARGGRPSDD